MKNRLLIILISVIMIFSFAGCASYDVQPSSSGSSAGVSAEKELSVLSMKTFESKAGKFGDVKDLTGDYGYDAALVNSKDNINYIYMYLPGADMAESIITDGDGDGEKDKDITVEKEGSNYALYIQDSDTLYAQYLRVGNMIVAVSGKHSAKDRAASAADSFFKELGYNL